MPCARHIPVHSAARRTLDEVAALGHSVIPATLLARISLSTRAAVQAPGSAVRAHGADEGEEVARVAARVERLVRRAAKRRAARETKVRAEDLGSSTQYGVRLKKLTNFRSAI